MAMYGSPRLTHDVDFIADTTAGIVGAPLRRVGGLIFGGAACKLGKIPVDIIVRSDGYAALYDAALDNAGLVGGVRVVTAPYLAAMKMAAHRDKDTVDLMWLLRHGIPDLVATRCIVCEYLGGQFAAEEFDLAVQEARLRRSMDTEG